MNIWGIYEKRIDATGGNKHDAFHDRMDRYISRKIRDNLSYHSVTIDDVEQDVAIINSDNLNEKMIYSMPGEHIRHGGLVFWKDNYWLITEKDANDTLYDRGRLIQCNYLLKWVSSDGIIHEQWCIVEDGTKYLTGEYEDRNFVIVRGDTRLSLTIAVNPDTAVLNRRNRFLIDHPLADPQFAYALSKPLRVGNRYTNDDGVFKFVLQEATTTDDDNQELGIADYYKYFLKENTSDNNYWNSNEDNKGKKVWI